MGRIKIFKKKVPIEDVAWAGSDVKEFFYTPKKLEGLTLKDFYNQALKRLKKPKPVETKIPKELGPEFVKTHKNWKGYTRTPKFASEKGLGAPSGEIIKYKNGDEAWISTIDGLDKNEKMIDQFVVNKERQGIGTRALLDYMKKLKSEGVKNVRVAGAVKKSYGFWKKVGFKDVDKNWTQTNPVNINKIIKNLKEAKAELSKPEKQLEKYKKGKTYFQHNIDYLKQELNYAQKSKNTERIKYWENELSKEKERMNEFSKAVKGLKEAKPVEKIKPKQIKVPYSQLPVERKAGGKRLASRLEKRMVERLSKVPERYKTATYKQMNKAEQIKKAVDYVNKNESEAMEVLLGKKEPPKGLLHNSIFLAMEEKAKDNTNLAVRLASLRATRMGQELSILTEADKNNPCTLNS
ncbi:MAG TPA: hypothetical protein ENL05_01445 [Candidatus Moranbacteria bacterium]|nr:hypothetical protein [Candidatus Moranbacteria bacterium]